MFDRFVLTPSWSARLGLACVLCLFCVPLFFGLKDWDLRNDEAIYSYSVDRMLETGDWVTPRTIGTDTAFLEKPPLKPWLVAAAIRLGLLPFDERGMRGVDAAMCTIAFIYVFFITRRLAGALAGAVAVFLLFSFDPLLLEHGIRGNNMEAALVLAYCAGVYHFGRWVEDADRRRARRHAYAVAGFFVLAFMTKFVASFFLPILCVVALLVRPGSRRWISKTSPDLKVRPTGATWREWIGPTVFAAVAILPWFIYEALIQGSELWNVMIGEHVLRRFGATLIPSHLKPWHHYFTQTWLELGFAGIQTIFVLGLIWLVFRAFRRREWFAQLMIVWWIVPFVLASLGTSKLFYYIYAFLPPLAVGAGGAAAAIVEFVSVYGRALAVRLGLKSLDAEREAARRRRPASLVLAAFGAVALAIAFWTFVSGPVNLQIGGVHLFRSSSVPRAILIGALFWLFAGFGSVLFRLIGFVTLAAVLPFSAYANRVGRFSSIDHPLQSARDCGVAVQASGARVGPGLFEASGDLHHAYTYYLRRLGPWQHPADAPPDELRRRLEEPGHQTPVLLSIEDYRSLGGVLSSTPYGTAANAPGPPVTTPATANLTHGLPAGIVIGDVVVILFPGPYARCADEVALGGARELPARPPR